MKKFLLRKWLGIPLVTIIAVILVTGVTAVGAIIFTPVSNLWTSPQVTVTPVVVPTHRPLVISSTWLSDSSAVTESTFDFPMTLSNPSDTGDPAYLKVNVDIKIWNATNDINPADLTLSYYDGANWQVIPTTGVNSAGIKLETTYGPSAGFPVAPGYNITTQFRVVFHKAGIYQASAQAQTQP